MNNQILQLEIPDNIILPDCGIPVERIDLLLTASELEQVKTALQNGKRIAHTYLNRTKNPAKRFCRGIDINNIDLSIYKAEHCKPQTLYPLKLLSIEAETLVYCLEHSKNSKSKDTQQLIAMLNACLYE